MEELDRQIAEIFGYPFRKPTHGTRCTYQVCGHGYDECQCGYSTDIEKAWAIAEKVGQPVTLYRNLWGNGEWHWHCHIGGGIDEDSEFWAEELTAPLAICKAALLYARSKVE